MKYLHLLFVISVFTISNGCAKQRAMDQPVDSSTDSSSDSSSELKVGAARFEEYLALLQDKTVGVVINQTSLVDGQSTLDYLLAQDVNVKKIFAPEHGIRGKADAGETIDDGKDSITGLPIISFYGKNKKPSAEALADIDIVIFDIQDVGTRFYTYISTLHYLMEACAENNKQLIVMDRPNPNGYYVTGPMMEDEHKSFVGMHNIPAVHGMTIGEYALMINGEGWLTDGLKCDLKVTTMEGWDHSSSYSLPVPPSPNLPNDQAIALYPSLCFIEGTVVSLGRGTTTQFQIAGHPDYPDTTFSFTPVSSFGAKYPKHQDITCYGLNLTQADTEFTLQHLIHFYTTLGEEQEPFFNDYFVKLAGTHRLREQIQSGMSEEDIIASWQPGLAQFKQIRAKYLQYKDFE
jgi:uncharacterized protein YbbC (DUF1343 family)